jgi:hypothetical protein
MIYDPGKDIAQRYPDWVVRHESLRGVPELLCPVRRVILIEKGMRRAERDCALAHAIAHLDLGHDLTMDRRAESREEQAADDLAAARLLPVWRLAEIGIWALSGREAAAELGVTENLLLVRWDNRTPDERRYLEVRMAAREGAA